MRIFIASAALAAFAVSATAFQPHSSITRRSSSTKIMSLSSSSAAAATASTKGTPCTMPDNIPPTVTAQTIRSAVLTNANGESVRLGDKMGPDTYAKAWCELQQESSFVKGPIFVSIGDTEKLQLFLEKNPHIPREQVLVDNYDDFAAYKAAGFARFDEQNKEVLKAGKDNMAAPDLGGWKGAWSYITNVGKLSPIPPDLKFGQIPEGVLRLGGTFVVSGNDIVYRWSDRLPGDHPDIENVYNIAKEAASKKKDIFAQLPKLFGL